MGHKSKSLGLAKSDGGVHALLATKFSRSRDAKQLRAAMDKETESDIALSSVRCLHSGYLYKRGNWNKDWKKRWFVLRSSLNLYYYESQSMKESQYRGVLALGNIRAMSVASSGFTQFSFDISTKSRVYHFACLNGSDLKDWMAVLECLMNVPLEDIAPNTKAVPLSDGLKKADPNRFRHRQGSLSSTFHHLTATSPTTGDANKRESVINRLVRSASKLTSKAK